MSDLRYQSGFGNELESEAIAGALPVGRNNPQILPDGLVAEQLSGSAFTALPKDNKRSWLYRRYPSVVHTAYQPYTDQTTWLSAPLNTAGLPPPDQLRWDPQPIPTASTDFIAGMTTVAVNGSVEQRDGSAVHLYVCNTSMSDDWFCNADGEMLIVPQSGGLHIASEFGALETKPGEICVMPRGVKFQVRLLDQDARGYVCENYGALFELPHRGPIGANGLANARDFLAPVANFNQSGTAARLLTKFAGGFWQMELKRSPDDVAAWHGNYYPYKYDLDRFNTMNTVSFDHPDPSIFTVLTSPSERVGTANVDFVIFPPRWMVAEDTFRPPYFHRNVMSEYMGLIHGVYDAKPAGGGFVPGGGSLHNCMSAHGPEAGAFDAASSQELTPSYQANTLAFMFESRWIYRPTDQALKSKTLQADYLACWQGLGDR